MAIASNTLAAVAFLALLPLGACASETAGGYRGPVQTLQGVQGPAPYGAPTIVVPARLTPPEPHEGLLSSPPNDARPGECYAKVVVPGQPIGAPPAQPRAVWVQTPPGPGQLSPTWCLYYLPGAPRPVAMTPERFGWIRVVCDKDATEEKIRHVQRRLHEWGDYDGAYDGHFDKVTAAGVVRFQEQRRIEHGGYLSVRTVEELDGAPPAYAPPAYPAPALQPAYSPTLLQTASAAGCGPAACAAPLQPALPSAAPCAAVACFTPPPPQIIYRQSPPQVVIQKVIQPVYQQVYAPPPPPQVIYQPSPPQVVVQKVIQPVYQQVYAQAPQTSCCMPRPQSYPCGGPVCGALGGQGWGGQGWGGGYQQGPAPYRALLTWSGKTTY